MFFGGGDLAAPDYNPLSSPGRYSDEKVVPVRARRRLPLHRRFPGLRSGHERRRGHPTTENVTVISGTFHIGAGDKFDQAASTALIAGGFASMPAKMHHDAWFKGETEVQAHGVGPFKLTYVNPKDDPTKAAARK